MEQTNCIEADICDIVEPLHAEGITVGVDDEVDAVDGPGSDMNNDDRYMVLVLNNESMLAGYSEAEIAQRIM